MRRKVEHTGLRHGYRIGFEYNGDADNHIVVRQYGEYVSKHATRNDAVRAIRARGGVYDVRTDTSLVVTYWTYRALGHGAKSALDIARASGRGATLPYSWAFGEESADWEDIEGDEDHEVRIWVEADDCTTIEDAFTPWGDEDDAAVYEDARKRGWAKAPARELVKAAREHAQEIERKIADEGWYVVVVEVRDKLTGHVGRDVLGGVESDYVDEAIIDHGMVATALDEARKYYVG